MLEIRLKILRGKVLKSKHFNVYFPALQFTVHVLDQAERLGSHGVTARHRCKKTIYVFVVCAF